MAAATFPAAADDSDNMALSMQGLGHGTADKTGASGDEYLHGSSWPVAGALHVVCIP